LAVIADDIRAALPIMQQQAESLMTSPCLITRPGTPVLDEDTGNITPTTVTVFSGYCKVQTRDTLTQQSESGSSAVAIQRYEVHVPLSSGPYLEHDLVEVSGRRFRVVGLNLKTWQTAQRLPVEEVI
jgi:hypothetical protein